MRYMYYLLLLPFIVLIIYFIFALLTPIERSLPVLLLSGFLKASTFLADTRLLMTLADYLQPTSPALKTQENSSALIAQCCWSNYVCSRPGQPRLEQSNR